MLKNNQNSKMVDEHIPLLEKNTQPNMNKNDKTWTIFRNFIHDRKILVDILSLLFGIGAWIGVNGMFLELPLIGKKAPESWSLPSYMSITVQMANIGPILYVSLRKCIPDKLNEIYSIYFLLIIGCASLILASFFYEITTKFGEDEHSTVFLVLLFFTSAVGCTSSVLFFPFMRHFKEVYLISYFIGEGLSGFLASNLALIQGIGGNTDCPTVSYNNNITENIKFLVPESYMSIKFYFMVIFLISCVSLVSFILLNHLKVCKNERVAVVDHTTVFKINSNEILSESPPKNNVEALFAISKKRSILLLVLMATINAFSNGAFPALQSYSCLPYGNIAYHLSIVFTTMAQPCACFLALFSPPANEQSVTVLTTISFTLTLYVIATAVLNQSAPLVETTAGMMIVVITWTSVAGVNSFIKLSISAIFRSAGEPWMVYCGLASQSGSTVGSVVFFLLIKCTNIFTVVDTCK